jgi:tetratricopeptide (TPR) repeat protein
MQRLLFLCGLTALVLLSRGLASGQDDQYLHIYGLIQEGDALGASGDATQALARYLDAQSALQRFQRTYPDWNPGVVKFRIGYLASKISEATSRPADSKPPGAAASNAPPKTAARGQTVETSEVEAQLNNLQLQVRQLQGDKMVLEAKLKESLAAQPAAMDPRELADAQSQVRSLQKENELLKVNLSQRPERPAPASDTQALEQTKRDLAEANRRVAEQTESANTLAREKTTLQSKLDSLIPADWNATNIAATRKALDDANHQLADETALATKLAQEKDELQSRLKTVTPDAEAAAALRTENDILKKQLAQLQSAPTGTPDEAYHQLNEALLKIAILRSDKEQLQRENSALDVRVKQLSSSASTESTKTVVAPVPVPASDSSARVRKLEHERDDLQKKLAAAQKQLAAKNNKANASRVEQLADEVEVLRARLGVFETQKVPYSPEELALLQPSTVPLADPKAGKASTRDLPAGSMVLVAEADRDFAARRFDQAEEKYLQVLKRDDKNLYTLANLAAIQMELNHLDDAEHHAQQALAVAPDDSYSLMILGEIQLRQEKYDDALGSLSRAAKADPRNAHIQNFLGLALSQKGMRSAAETAFRQAVTLEPDYPAAHNNLAVFYLNQKPPATALAHWHYDKARAAGMPPNPELEKMFEAAKAQ